MAYNHNKRIKQLLYIIICIILEITSKILIRLEVTIAKGSIKLFVDDDLMLVRDAELSSITC